MANKTIPAILTNEGNVGIGISRTASLNTTTAVNGTGGGNRGFDTSFTGASSTGFTGSDSTDQGFGYFAATIVSGRSYEVSATMVVTNGAPLSFITSSGLNFATQTVQSIASPPVSNTTYRFVATADAAFFGIGINRTSGTMTAVVSNFSIKEVGSTLVTSDTNVGIGVASPTSLLHISGAAPTIKLQGSSSASAKVDLAGTYTTWSLENQYVNGATNDMFRIYNSALSADAITINRSTNNVGIGTTNPSSKLHIDDATTPWITISRAGVPTWQLRNNFPSNQYGFSFNNTTAGTVPLFIGAGGNIGIGLDSPAAKLDIVGTNTTIALSFGTTVPNNPLFINTYAGSMGIGMDQTTAGIRLAGDYSSAAYPLVDIGYYSGGTVSHANWVNRLRVQQNGNVGIGITNPASKLHVSGAGATIMRLDAETLTSVAQFQAKANTDGVLIAGMYGPNPVAGTVFGANTSGAAFLGTTTLATVHPTLLAIGTSNIIPIIFGTNSTERMCIAGAGNVGIGTTNPATKLHVYSAGGGFEFGVGSSNCYIETIDRANTSAFINTSYYTRGTGYFAWSNGSYTERMRIDGAGNVGIGTVSPIGKLTVQGNIEVNYNSITADSFVRRTFLTQHAVINRGANIKFGLIDGGGLAGMGVYNVVSSDTAYNSQFIAFNTHEGNVSADERMRITQLGDVGIGTFTPLSLLTVGTAGSTTAAKGLSFGGDAQANLYRSAEDTIKTDGSLEVTTSLNIGADLYVADELGVGVLIANKRVNYGAQISAASASIQLVLGRTADSTGQGAIGADNGNTFAVWNVSGGFTKQLVVTQQGDVSIGTDTPNYKLEVNGIIGLYGASNKHRKLAQASNWGYSSSYRTIILGSTSSTYNVADGAVTLCFGVDVSANANGSFQGDGRELVFRNLTRFVTPNAANTSYLNPLTFNNGNVGIGSDVPGAKLDVNGDVYVSPNTAGKNTFILSTNASNDARLLMRSDVTTKVDIQANGTSYFNGGNVGIGETSPIQKLHVLGNTVFGNFGNNTYKYNLYLSFEAAADESWVRIYLPQNYFSANNGGTVKVRVLWAGDHATFGAHEEYQISYKTFYPSPYLTFSKIICTNKTTDFGGGTYYTASSTPDVIFYSNADDYLYIKIKGFSATYNRSRFIEAEVFGRTVATPTITTTTAPASSTELVKTIQFLPQEGNIYAAGSVGIGTTSAASPLSVQSNSKQLRLQTTNGPTSFFTDIGARYDSSHPFTIEVANGAATATEYFGIYADAGGANNRIALLNGNVGIGTTVPTQKLDIVGSYGAPDDNAGILKIRGAGVGPTQLNFGVSADGGYGWIQATDIAVDNDRDIILGPLGGNIGIGTTSPVTLLTVGSTTTTTSSITLQGEYQSSVFNNTNIFNFRHGGFDRWRLLTTQNSAASNDFDFSVNAINAATNGYNTFLTIKGLNGNVGIGTVSPSTLLSVGGAGSTLPASGITFGGNSVANLYRSEADHIKTDGSFVVTNTLIVGGGQNGIRILKNGSDSISSNLYIANAANTRVFNFQQNAAGTNLALWTYNSANAWQNTVNFNYNGSVGIGTTTPSGKLHIVSTIAGETVLRTDGTNGTLFSVVDDLSDSLMSVNNSAGLPVLEVFADDRVVAGQYGSGDFVLINNKVGIGTTNPTNKLSVIGGASIGPSTYNVAAPSNGLIVEGKVGIGTTNPVSKLHVKSSLGQDGIMIDSTTYSEVAFKLNGGTAKSYLSLSSVAGGYIIGSSANSLIIRNDSDIFMSANAGATSDITIKNGGNVGIGTTAPSRQLELFGNNSDAYIQLTRTSTSYQATLGFKTGATDDWLIRTGDNSTSNLLFYSYGTSTYVLTILRASGNVGIGVVSPADKLEVNGTTRTKKLRSNGIYYVGITGTKSSNASAFDMFDISNTGGNQTIEIVLSHHHSGGGQHGSFRRVILALNGYVAFIVLEDTSTDFGGGLGFTITRTSLTTMRIGWAGATAFASGYTFSGWIKGNGDYSVTNVGMDSLDAA